MNRLAFISFFFLLLTSLCNLSAQTYVSGRIETEIVTPITVLESESLNFGRIINSEGGGEVIITPAGQRTNIGNVALFSNDFFSAAKFIITGAPGKVINITLPTDIQKAFSDATSQSLNISNFISSMPASGVFVPSANGATVITIGATLNIDNLSIAQPGKYYGTYEVAFSYN